MGQDNLNNPRASLVNPHQFSDGNGSGLVHEGLATSDYVHSNDHVPVHVRRCSYCQTTNKTILHMFALVHKLLIHVLNRRQG